MFIDFRNNLMDFMSYRYKNGKKKTLKPTKVLGSFLLNN
tara:strand:- start:505 stop:621 length:117 start_codon:yes stop_codon:yes gene_type:complete